MAVAFLNGNNHKGPQTGSTFTGTFQVDSGSNLCFILLVHWDDQFNGGDVASVTINGVAMTALGAKVGVGGSPRGYNRAYYLVAPTIGASVSFTLTWSRSDVINQSLLGYVYTGVNQSTPIRASSYTTFSGTSGSDGKKAITISSATGDRVVTAIAHVEYTTATSVTPGTLRFANLEIADWLAYADDAGAASVTETWDTSAGATINCSILGASLQAAVVTPPADYTWLRHRR